LYCTFLLQSLRTVENFPILSIASVQAQYLGLNGYRPVFSYPLVVGGVVASLFRKKILLLLIHVVPPSIRKYLIEICNIRPHLALDVSVYK
jgi:hypothetical protein